VKDKDEIKKQALTAYFVGHGGRVTVDELAYLAITDRDFVREYLDDLVQQGKVTKDGEHYVQVKQV
jgi:DNA-binding IclR family transcriptional regulator